MRLQKQFGAHRTCQGPQAPVGTLILTFHGRGTWGNSLVGLCFLWWPVAVVGGIWVEKGVMTEKKIRQVSSWSASPPRGWAAPQKGSLGVGGHVKAGSVREASLSSQSVLPALHRRAPTEPPGGVSASPTWARRAQAPSPHTAMWGSPHAHAPQEVLRG